jgi:putative membrane protein
MFTLDRLALWIPLVLHTVGTVGILAGYAPLFLGLTALNLLVCGGVVLAAAREQASWGWVVGAAGGFAAEVVGVNTGLLFGDYAYGEGLGPHVAGVPVLLGWLWLLMLEGGAGWARRWGVQGRWGVAAVGATLMTAVDGLLEPVAVQAGWWVWGGGTPPWTNYASWWGVSFLLLAAQPVRPGGQAHAAPARLLLIFAVFFCLLNLFPWTR